MYLRTQAYSNLPATESLSWRVTEKIGMIKEATSVNGGWWDELFYVILEEDRC
ncbi:hypothetical protein [Clostridium thermosuccinogenes]|uniref:hypothetical protein n=1 Tax=Clostridium thermosuccinogenes TaxID=84032 RepID=UPI001930FC3E|nr:hypothetical protein [Pseudoclostridium thermosuccinogenes]